MPRHLAHALPAARSARGILPRERRASFARLALLLATAVLSSCASDPAASDAPIAAEVFWVRSDDKVGTIDHSLVSASLPEAEHRPQVREALEMRRASRKTIPDWRMHQLLEAIDDRGFESLAQNGAQPGAWDLIGVVRDGKTRILSIFHTSAKRMSEADHRRAREIYYIFSEVDNSTTGFQTQSTLRPDDFEAQQEQIRRGHEEALRRKQNPGGSGS
ncbi:MAG: hypothetical protein IPN34_07150 [Planctomycetes bacterium]|nr:hypothetical protein [Planctomycetota bacterium]